MSSPPSSTDVTSLQIPSSVTPGSPPRMILFDPGAVAPLATSWKSCAQTGSAAASSTTPTASAHASPTDGREGAAAQRECVVIVILPGAIPDVDEADGSSRLTRREPNCQQKSATSKINAPPYVTHCPGTSVIQRTRLFGAAE